MSKSRITGIQRQPRSRERYSVSINGEYALTVSEHTLADLGIRDGQSIDPGMFNEIRAAEEARRAFEAALRILRSRDHTAGEVRVKLGGKGYESQTVEKVVHRLQELGLINDRRFVREWVSESLDHRPAGREKLVHDLQQKGVDRATIDEVLSTLMDETAEITMAQKLARKLMTKSDGCTTHTTLARIADSLRRRGFAEDTIETVLCDLGKAIE